MRVFVPFSYFMLSIYISSLFFSFVIDKKDNTKIELNEVYGFPNETSYLGGYDVKGKIDIKSGNYFVKDAEIWFSTGPAHIVLHSVAEML